MIDVGKGFYSRIWKGFVTKVEGISDAATHGDQGLIGLRIWRKRKEPLSVSKIPLNTPSKKTGLG
jgi:hypothetical protein